VNILIIGRGRVGNALRRGLEASKAHRVTQAGRRVQPSAVRAADVVVLAVSDEAIRPVAEAIAPSLRADACVVHCAGARDVGELVACRARGAAVGVMHPLVSFPSKKSYPSLQKTTFTVHGSQRAITASRQIAAACGAHAVMARTADPAYHAAAALTANGAAALAFVSVRVLVRFGFQRRAAERAIGGLLRSVGDNVQGLGVPEALTGPIARGDSATVAAHRRALRRLGRDALGAYDALLPVIVRCARAAGLPKRKADEILAVSER
jgi:predicted short-subunit dehydrogenase-like oxidoreductase (DUF2520 family)